MKHQAPSKPLTISNLPTSSVKAYERNPRVHTRQSQDALIASILEYGFTNPIIVDEHRTVIAGHGRLRAALELGRETVPVIQVDHLSEKQKKGLRIADNKIASKSAWSPELLTKELTELVIEDFDMSALGFDAIELDAYLTPDMGSMDETTYPPLPAEPKSRPGDLYGAGDSWIWCGDARVPASYERVLGGRKADMVFTDFPYNRRINGHVSGNGKKVHDEFAMASGEMSREQFKQFLAAAIVLMKRNSRDGSLHYLFSDWRMIGLLTQLGEELLGELFNIVVWAKANGGMGSFYRSQHELIPIFKNGNGPHVNNIQLGRMGRNRTNVWHYPGASGFSKSRKRDLADHPTVKPVALVAEAIRDATNPGDLVLDPFGGAGTTLIAAHKVGRKAALIEIEPKYVDVTLRRFREETGIEPVLLQSAQKEENTDD